MIFFGRDLEMRRLREFWEESGSGLVMVRGRRRIGKSELLRKLIEDLSKAGGRAFRFEGRVDESDIKCRKRWASAWSEFTGSSTLADLKSTALTWDRIFLDIARIAKLEHPCGLPLLVVFDEIQWLAKRHSGVLGSIKEFWEVHSKQSTIKLALSGSSNRFFSSVVDNPEGVLRGLRTKGDLWVHPFTLDEVNKYYFPAWNKEEVCLLYMMFGGVPYYLEQFDKSKPFLRALNDAALTTNSIFLDEIDAILKVESSGEGALANVKRVLSSLGQDGKTVRGIEDVTRLGETNVHSIINRLESYGLIKERKPLGDKKKNRAGFRYFMEDFYLNTYFQLLEPMTAKIRDNNRGAMLISGIIKSDNGYYIPDFTGKAFELLLIHLISDGTLTLSKRKSKLFQKLGVIESDIEVGTYWSPNQTQIDIVISCNDDRRIRVLEAKWKSARVGGAECLSFIEAVKSKKFPLPGESWTRKDYLVLSSGATGECKAKAQESDVAVIEIDDLFAP